MYTSKEPLISIIVPVYNVEKYLTCCIESIVGQTYKNLEILLMDDGSTDSSPEICDRYAAQDRRIRVIHKGNGGSADARNAGLDQATGEYILFIDSDDLIHPEMVGSLFDSINKKQAEIAMCGFMCVGENSIGSEIADKTSGERRLNDETISVDTYWSRYYRHPDVVYIAVWNKLVRRDLYDTVRFKKGKVIDDEFVIHRLLSQCQKVSCIKENLYYYRKRTGSIMSSEYSIRHLDVVEARIERALFFYSSGQQYFAEKSVTYALSELLDAKEKIDLTKYENRERFSELRKICHQAGKQIVRSHSSFTFKIAYLTFCLGDRSYIRLMQIRRRI